MADSIFLPGNILSMAAGAADRLIQAGNGDAALLYLVLLKSPGSWEPAKAASLLKWDPGRVSDAYNALVSFGLALPANKVRAPEPTPAVASEPPTYSAADLNREMENADSPLPGLVREIQRMLGKLLSGADLRSIYTIYDYIGMPPEVILLVVNWCNEEAARKYGQGRTARLPQIQREALRWKEQGIDTVEAADAHIKRLTLRRDRTRQVMALLDLRDRPAVAKEQDYIDGWLAMGFGDEPIRLAYEKTIMSKNKLVWGYLNSILKRWHEKGLHTLEQIQAGDHDRPAALRAPTPQSGVPAGAADQRARDDMERMRAYLAQQKEDD